jgi:hypothetical protein
MEYLSAIKLFEGMREVYLKSAAKEKNRGNAMIAMTIKGLRETIEKHRKWLNDRDNGERANLSNVNLRNVNLCNVDLSYANLRGSDLFCANLQGANLQGANLQCVSLVGTYLRYANLQGANLQHADLQYADLRNADLQNTALQEADLRYAYLMAANLSYSKLAWTDLSYAVRPWLITISNIGSRKAETLYFADKDIVLCGCWNNYRGGTLDEFKAKIDKIYPADSKDEMRRKYRVEYLRAIEMFEPMREAYLKSAEAEKHD